MTPTKKQPRFQYESPNIVIVPTLSFCKGPSTKDKEPTVEETKTVRIEERVETFQIPCIIQNSACETVLNQDLDPVTSVPVTSNFPVDHVQNSSQFQNNNLEWSMNNEPLEIVQLTQTRSRHPKPTKNLKIPSESEKNVLPSKSPIENNEREIKMPQGITKRTEFDNKTSSLNQSHTKRTPFERTNDNTKQRKTSTTKPINKIHRRSQQNSQTDRHAQQMKSKKNKEESIRKTIDKSKKSKRMQSKSTPSHEIKQLLLEIKKIDNEIQKRKREWSIKEMLIQKEKQAINQAKQHEQTIKDKDITLRANSFAESSISKSNKNELSKKFRKEIGKANELEATKKFRKEIGKANELEATDELISKIQNIKKKYEIMTSTASKETITSDNPGKKLLHVKSVVNVPQQISLDDTVTLQNQYKYNKEKYTILQNDLKKPLIRTIHQSKSEPQSQEENLKQKCNIKYRKTEFEGNYDNLHIMLNNKNKETEEQLCDRKVKLQKKRKREKNSQSQPINCKKIKKIELFINVVTEDSILSSDSEENETTFEKESSPAVDFSFLDDINVDEIAEYLNGTHDIKDTKDINVSETENTKFLDQSVSFKDNIKQGQCDNEGKGFLNNNSSQPLIHKNCLNDDDTTNKEKMYEENKKASIKNHSEIITQTIESDSITRKNQNLHEDVRANRNSENSTSLLPHVMTKLGDSSHKDRFIEDHGQTVTQSVAYYTKTVIKTVDTIVIADSNSYDASVTETVADNLFDKTRKVNKNSDVKSVKTTLETKSNDNSDVKIVDPILETVDLTEEDIFTIELSSDDGILSSISSDSNKYTDAGDSILDIHIKHTEIVDLNIDSVENENNDSNTSNNLEVPEIKSAAGIQIKKKTNQEHIAEQPNTRHEIVPSEKINAKCQNNTSLYRKNPTSKNKVHVNIAAQDIQIAEKNLPTQDKKNSENIAKQSCPTKFQSIDPKEELTTDINDKLTDNMIKNMTDRILEYIHIKYTVTCLIHDGKFSQIFKCRDSTGNVIAAKISKEDDVTTGYEREQMLMKVQDGIPKEKLTCVYLINGLAVESKWCYLLEYYSQNLQQALNEYGSSFHVDTMLSFAQQLVSAVVILRNNNIVHSDIKPSHILVDSKNKQLKLCGFDAAYYLEHMQMTGEVGTSNYRAPEAILGYSKGHSVDVWATALVLHEMATNQKLFPGSTKNEVLYQQMCILGKVPWLMVERSEFKDTYFRGNCFLRQKPFEMILKFSRSPKVKTSVFEAYYQDWFHLRNAAQRREDLTRLRDFCYVLKQMLVLVPDHRLPIEFVYAHPLIYSQK